MGAERLEPGGGIGERSATVQKKTIARTGPQRENAGVIPVSFRSQRSTSSTTLDHDRHFGGSRGPHAKMDPSGDAFRADGEPSPIHAIVARFRAPNRMPRSVIPIPTSWDAKSTQSAAVVIRWARSIWIGSA